MLYTIGRPSPVVVASPNRPPTPAPSVVTGTDSVHLTGIPASVKGAVGVGALVAVPALAGLYGGGLGVLASTAVAVGCGLMQRDAPRIAATAMGILALGASCAGAFGGSTGAVVAIVRGGLIGAGGSAIHD